MLPSFCKDTSIFLRTTIGIYHAPLFFITNTVSRTADCITTYINTQITRKATISTAYTSRFTTLDTTSIRIGKATAKKKGQKDIKSY